MSVDALIAFVDHIFYLIRHNLVPGFCPAWPDEIGKEVDKSDSSRISADRNFWLAKVAGHGRKKFGQFGIFNSSGDCLS